MEYWKRESRKWSQRCDFLHLPKSFQGPRLNFENYEKKLAAKRCNFTPIWSENGKQDQLRNIMVLAWHKTLSVYGSGSQTVTLNCEETSSQLIPIIIDHVNVAGLDIGQIVSQMDEEIKASVKNERVLEWSGVWNGFCDSFILWETLSSEMLPKTAPFCLQILGEGNPFEFQLMYNGELFNEKFAGALLDYFVTAVELLLRFDSATRLSKIEFVSKEQVEKLLEWNEMSTGSYPEEKRLNHLVEEAAKATPAKVAVISKNCQITYAQLNTRANQIAHLLISKLQVKAEHFIALFLDKTEVLLMTILGIWKSGAAHIPIDPQYPDDRVKFILQDTGAKTLIGNAKYINRLEKIFADEEIEIFYVEDLLKEAVFEPTTNLQLPLTSSQLAYVTYTSGTTGVPKGVYKEHKGVVNSITDLSIRYGMVGEKDEVVALFSVYVFEPFIRQTLIALVNSQTLVIADDEEKLDLEKFPKFLEEHKVTYLNGTGSVLQEFDLRRCTSLNKLILVGEELTPRRYESLREQFKGLIICEYGFTESALVTCLNFFDLKDKREDRSIGRPARNVKAYILDEYLNRVPIGAIGNLYIGGVGISRGYMNREKLTRERFLDNPFQLADEKEKGENKLMYKTGDLARWMDDGRIEFIGRNDFQIKLRGNRIEPGEIENVAIKMEKVTNCLVVVKDSEEGESGTGSRYLVGYYVAEGEVKEEDIISHLEKKLPKYMIPVRMVQVDKLKTNINGKVDLKALPEVKWLGKVEAGELARDEVDSKLIEIWKEVLRIKFDLGIKADFSRLGGHSISCIHLVSRVRRDFGVELSIAKVFGLRTVEKMSDLISHEISTNSREGWRKRGMKMLPGQNKFLANSLQQGLVYHYLKQGKEDDAYLMQSHYKYGEKIEVSQYKKAWKLALDIFPGLRVNFEAKEKIYQIVRQEMDLDWIYFDLAESERKAEEISRIIAKDRQLLYNLEEGQLFRVILIKEEEHCFSLVFSYHHIILDGWSLPILFGFVHETYRKFMAGEAVEMEGDNSFLQSQMYLEEHKDDHLDYWRKEVERVASRADLSGLLKPEVKYKEDLKSYSRIEDQGILLKEIGADLLSKFKTFQEMNTLHSILQFGWHQVLQAYGAGSHTITGTTVAGRNIPVDGVEKCVGLFINTLPLIVDHSKEVTISEAVKDIQRIANEMNCKSNVELGRLGGDMKHSLFNSLFVLEPEMDFQKSPWFSLVKDYEKLDYPLVFIAREEKGKVLLELRYAKELFDDQSISDMLHLFKFILDQAISNPALAIQDLQLTLPSQLLLLEKWNLTKLPFPEDQTIHQVFERIAETKPLKTALIFEEEKWSYEQLNSKANHLAVILRSMAELEKEDKIALSLQKNDLLILAILAVWKAGCAFVPIDPDYPAERIKFMLADTNAKLIIINEDKKLDVASPRQVSIENALKSDLLSNFTLPSPCNSSDLCYIIYTSGTTGQPKGVMVEHRGVVNLHKALLTLFNLDSEAEVFLSFSNVVFDHFVEQMTDALLSGQTLVVLNDDMRWDKERLYNYIRKNKVSYLSGTPSVLSMYEYSGMPSLKRIDAVGEDFSPAYFDKIRASFKGTIINGYGPTEVSITTHKKVYTRDEKRIDKSIGHQLSNCTCYILSEKGQRLPVGGIGELYLGGVGVARGYLNRQDLTEKVFIQNPFVTEEELGEGFNLRLYKTGDLARFLPNGEVECLGRVDSQVKVRGLRIELSEIEGKMLEYSGVSHCVVVAHKREQGTQYLVGYFVADCAINMEEFASFLGRKLPGFMVPNRLLQVDSIPVNKSGKCDIKALPKVEFSHKSQEDDFNLTETEIKIRLIFSKLLTLPPQVIGINEDFFSLGGDSLLAISMSFMISNEFKKSVGVPQIFLHKTVKALAQFVTSSERDAAQLHNDLSFVRASPAQERLLFIDKMEGGTAAFNIPFLIKLNKDTDAIAAVKALKEVVKRHEVLRTLLIKKEYLYIQKILNDEEFEPFWPDVVSHKMVGSEDEAKEEIRLGENHVFKLDREIPLRLLIIKYSSNEIFFSIVFHHTCFDGWSFPIFFRDWISFFKHPETHSKELAKPTFKYKDFALSQGNNFNQCDDYWLQKLSQAEQLCLPTDFERPPQFLYSGYELVCRLDPVIYAALKEFGRFVKVSPFSIFAAAFALTLSIYSGQEDILIGSPVSNRSPGFEDVIGFFVNILPLSFQVRRNLSLKDYLVQVREEVTSSIINQDMSFEKLIKLLGVEKNMSRHPLVQVMLNFNPLSGFKSEEEEDLPYQLVEEVPGEKETTSKYDLSVTFSESKNNKLLVNFTYAQSLFRKSTVEGYLNNFIHILTEFGRKENWEKKLNEMDFIGELESKILPEVNGHPEAIEGRDLPKLFEEIAEKCSSNEAIIYYGKRMSYAELSWKSDQVAGLIQTKNEGVVVAICMDKSDWLIVAILGIWKAGAAYVPIDPKYPSSRIQFILNDTRASLLVTDQANHSHLNNILDKSVSKPEIVILDAKTFSKCQTISPDSLAYKNNLSEKDLAYIIYTSGTTGNPKGVIITHGNVLSFRDSLLPHHKKGERVLFLSNFVFDFSIEQLILSLFNSGTLILIENDFVLNNQLYSYLNSNRLSYLSGTPSILTAFDLSQLKYLETVTTAGEKFTKSHFTKIRSGYKGRLINAYGLTESTVYNSICVFPEGINDYVNSLGIFLSNTFHYVLDNDLRAVPNGAVGELYLAGPCLASGYFNSNGNNFIQNSKFPSTLYKTGDLVRRLPSGELEYLHRNDKQVKIRGYRIQLEEVECTLMKHEGIKQCSAIFEDGAILCFYVLAEELKKEKLHSFLVGILPSQMIPTLVRFKGESLPVTSNGKLDVKELLKFYKETSSAFTTNLKSPTGKFEKKLCKIFGSVLAIPDNKIGANSDFFQLGGDSISCMSLAGRICNKLKVKCVVKDIFEYRNVEKLAKELAKREIRRADEDEGFSYTTPSGTVPLLPIQKWFFAKPLKSFNNYNQTFSIRVPPLDLEKLRDVLKKLLDHHDAFRLRFIKTPTGYVQKYSEDDSPLNFYHLNVTGLNEVEVDEKKRKLSSSLDIEHGPLYAVVYLEDEKELNFKLWWSVHHLIVDTVSWRIIRDDLEVMWEGIGFDRKGMSYKQYSHSLEGRFLSEEKFWARILEKVYPFNEEFLRCEGDPTVLHFTIDPEQSKRLLCSKENVESNLLTALGYALAKLTGSLKNYVTLEGHGRSKEVNLSNTMGWFTSMHPVELCVDPDISIQESIKSVRRSLKSIPNKGLGYGTLFGYVDNPLPCIFFNYLGAFSGKADGDWSFCDLSLKLSSDDAEDGLKENRKKSLADVTGAFQDGRLSFTFNLNLQPEFGKDLLKNFVEGLKMVSESVKIDAYSLGDFEWHFMFPAEGESESSPTLFMLPPGEGGGESYMNNLVPKLKQFNLVVFNNYYLHCGKPSTTFEELAAIYIERVKDIQPNGPYNFLGWSFGGVLSLEISRQLVEAGSSIDNIFIIDSYMNVNDALKQLDLHPELEMHEIIDKINIKYQPTPKDFENMLRKTKHVILFKAAEPNEMAKSEGQRKLFEYFRHALFNNLDSWIPSRLITAHVIKGHSHISWAKDDNAVDILAQTVKTTLNR